MSGFEDWTYEDVLKHNAKIRNKPIDLTKIQPIGNKVIDKPKKSKYGANRVEIDGIKFDSQKEAEYYQELKLRLAAKDIKGFCRQPEFVLASNLRYKADFIVFNNDGTSEIIDVKGMKTPVYINKKKMFEDKFNLKIVEV